MSEVVRCLRCGRLLHTGEGRVLVPFTTAELAELIGSTVNPVVRDRLLCALGLIDESAESELR